MNNIEVKEDFFINGKKIKIISGAVHYFRIINDHWKDSLLKLKEMGCNTVETYIPWNYHEKHQGQFNFSGDRDIKNLSSLQAR